MVPVPASLSKIVAKELSRLACNGRLSYELRDICQFNNIHIVCLDNYCPDFLGASEYTLGISVLYMLQQDYYLRMLEDAARTW